MKFHTQLKAKDIFKFSLAYTYSGVQAILTIFMLGVGAYMIVHGIGQPEGRTNRNRQLRIQYTRIQHTIPYEMMVFLWN